MKKAMKFLRILLVVAGTLSDLHSGSIGDGSQSGSIEAASDREITRRQEDMLLAEQAIKAGDTARARKEAQAAYDYYKQAVDMVPRGTAGGGLRKRALTRFSQGAVEYAEYLVSRGQYADARRVANEVLESRYNPDYQPAIVFLSHLDEANYFNKTVTPELAAQRDEVGKLMTEAVGFYDSGRFVLATERYRAVLGIDPENAAALRGLEQVETAKQRYFETAYNETRARMLWQVESAWARPVPSTETTQNSSSLISSEDDRADTKQMEVRLERFVLDRVGPFQDATIQEVVAWFRERSLEDAGDGGPINITLQLPSSQPAVPLSIDIAGTEAVPPNPPAVGLVTLDLRNVPFLEALRYAATLANMKVKVDPYAVSIIPSTESSEVLAVREFKVPPDFFSAARSAAAENNDPVAFAGRSPDAEYEARLRTAGSISAEEFFRQRGIEFPPGATASLAPGSTKLVVRNTPSALEFIEVIVEAATMDQPKQVEISAKFVEISQNNLKELGFDWTLGPFSIGGSGVYGGGGDAVATGRTFPFAYPGSTTPVGVDTATGGLRTGSGSQPYSAISVNSLSALLLQNLNLGLTGSGGPGPGIFSIAGIYTNPQFQVLIRALNQKKGVDLMAAPKVVAKPGQRAKINISRQFPYPTEFDPPQIPQDTGGSISTTTASAGGALIGGSSLDTSDPIVTPSFPTAFTTRDLGVILEVEPQVGADGSSIDLSLSPEVVDFEGFINYGSPIFAPPALSTLDGALSSATLGLVQAGQRQLLTENTINQPIFSTRKVTTNVSIWDGQTVALGGLIREDIQKVSDKVPILGDIPLAGVLFRSEVEQKLKRNLIIFVTARLIDAYGQPLRPEDDSDQVDLVEPLGLPPEVHLPARGNPKGLTGK